jgi:CRP-like cAMP-binding protein
VVAASGTLLGETALLAETVRPATAVAREESAVLRISRTMFMKMLESYPEAAQRVRDMIASRADQWAREMDSIRAMLARGTGPS